MAHSERARPFRNSSTRLEHLAISPQRTATPRQPQRALTSQAEFVVCEQAIYYYLRRWQREGIWDRVHHTLVMADRERAGREASPTAAILDSQSVRTADQKGDRRAMMRARRSKDAIATS